MTYKVIIENAGNNLSAYVEDFPICTVGYSEKEIKKNAKEAIELFQEGTSREGRKIKLDVTWA